MAPQEAWRTYVLPSISSPGWIEDSHDVSPDLRLSKRELLGLIVLAHLRIHTTGDPGWQVGFDPARSEPNDGFITDGSETVNVEHKVITQMAPEPALERILSTYDRYALPGRIARR